MHAGTKLYTPSQTYTPETPAYPYFPRVVPMVRHWSESEFPAGRYLICANRFSHITTQSTDLAQGLTIGTIPRDSTPVALPPCMHASTTGGCREGSDWCCYVVSSVVVSSSGTPTSTDLSPLLAHYPLRDGCCEWIPTDSRAFYHIHEPMFTLRPSENVISSHRHATRDHVSMISEIRR